MKIGISLPVREYRDDLGAIKDFAQTAEGLGRTHLRVPDQVIRRGNGHLHDPLTLLAYVAAITEKIELVPSVIVLPLRQTAMVARQSAEVDRLSGGRLRLGVGVGKNAEEYEAMGADFHTRGARCSEQMELLKRLWCEETVTFHGAFDQVDGLGINPLPVQKPIPMWVGASGVPAPVIVERIGRLADGWFVLCGSEDYPGVRDAIAAAARAAGRDADRIGAEAGVAVVGPRESEWQDRVRNWKAAGLTHLCLRTLGGGLEPSQHIPKMEEAVCIVKSWED